MTKEKSQFETRCEQLYAMGLKFDFNRNNDGGNYIYHGGINFHWTDITCMDNDKWDETVAKIATVKKQVDEQLQETLKKNYETNTLPFINADEKPVDLVVDRMGISYFTPTGREVNCPTQGGVWLNKLEIPCEIPYEQWLIFTSEYLLGILDKEMNRAHVCCEIAESFAKDVAQTMLNEVDGKIVECLNLGIKDVSGLLELKKTYEAMLKDEQG